MEPTATLAAQSAATPPQKSARSRAWRAARGAATAIGVSIAVSGCSMIGLLTGDPARTGDYATASIPAAPTIQTGVAAWDGDVSAPGMTAAHPTLQRGSWARVTNTATGQSAVVRVDRTMTPMRGRDIELSRDAAAAVGALQQGVAPVLIEPIDPRQATPTERAWAPAAQPMPQPQPVYTAPAPVETARYEPAPAYDPNLATATIPGPNTAYRPAPQRTLGARFDPHYLQLGSFRDRTNAERLARRLTAEGLGTGAYGDAFVETAYVEGSVFHRVRLGPLENATLADRALRDARALGHSSARILKP